METDSETSSAESLSPLADRFSAMLLSIADDCPMPQAGLFLKAFGSKFRKHPWPDDDIRGGMQWLLKIADMVLDESRDDDPGIPFDPDADGYPHLLPDAPTDITLNTSEIVDDYGNLVTVNS